MFSLSPFSTFISLSINMSFNLKSSFYSRFDKRLLSMHAPSLSLHICYSYLNNIWIPYVNVTTTQPHPPQKKMLCNMQITGCTCIQTKQINSLQDYYLYVYMYPRGSMAIWTKPESNPLISLLINHNLFIMYMIKWKDFILI